MILRPNPRSNRGAKRCERVVSARPAGEIESIERDLSQCRTVSMQILMPTVLCFLSGIGPTASPDSSSAAASIQQRIVESDQTGKLVQVPARIHIVNAEGKAILAPEHPAFNDHFNCDGLVRLDLPAGNYSYTVERG